MRQMHSWCWKGDNFSETASRFFHEVSPISRNWKVELRTICALEQSWLDSRPCDIFRKQSWDEPSPVPMKCGVGLKWDFNLQPRTFDISCKWMWHFQTKCRRIDWSMYRNNTITKGESLSGHSRKISGVISSQAEELPAGLFDGYDLKKAVSDTYQMQYIWKLTWWGAICSRKNLFVCVIHKKKVNNDYNFLRGGRLDY